MRRRHDGDEVRSRQHTEVANRSPLDHDDVRVYRDHEREPLMRYQTSTFVVVFAFLMVAPVGRADDAKAAVEKDVAALQDKDPKVRARAAAELRKARGHAELVVPALVKALKDADESVRYQAAFALGEFGPDAAVAVEGLAGLVKDDKQVLIRLRAVEA